MQLSTISVRLLQTLERFRKEEIGKAREEKKRFDKATERYYDALQKHLSTSTKKKDFFEVRQRLDFDNDLHVSLSFSFFFLFIG